MTPASVCESYLSQLDRCVAELRAAGLTEGRRFGDFGAIAGFGSYQFHGFGCRLEMADGDLVDFDWEAGDRSGKVIFDGWRLRAFARTRGLDFTLEQLVDAASRLADEGAIVAMIDRPGWFAVRN